MNKTSEQSLAAGCHLSGLELRKIFCFMEKLDNNVLCCMQRASFEHETTGLGIQQLNH